MADNYKAQRAYLDKALKANPNHPDLTRAKEMLDYRQSGKLPSAGATPDAAKMKANAIKASVKGPLSPAQEAARAKEYATRTAAGDARRAAAKAATSDVGRRTVRDVAGKVAKAASRTLGLEFGLVAAAVPYAPSKSPEMKSLDALREAASKVY